MNNSEFIKECLKLNKLMKLQMNFRHLFRQTLIPKQHKLFNGNYKKLNINRLKWGQFEKECLKPNKLMKIQTNFR